MTISWQKIAKIGASIFDQAWLSGISLLISLIFVKELEKSEFGLYVLLFNTCLFFQGIGGALLAAPYTTLHTRKQGAHKKGVIEIFTKGTLVFAAAAAMLAGLTYAAFGAWSNDPLLTTAAGFGFAVCILGSIAKDNTRVYQYSRQDPAAALSSNLIYGGMLLGGIFLMVQTDTVSAAGVLMAIGVCSAVVSVPRLLKPMSNDITDIAGANAGSSAISTAPKANTRQLVGEYWACGRWAALGSLVTFLTSNTYPYLAAISFSKAEVADISVARLMSMPIALIGAAWFNLMRSRLSEWAAEHRYAVLDSTVKRSVVGAAALSVGVAVLISVSGDLVHRFFGEKYANLRTLNLLWTAQTGLAFIKGIYAATLMTGDNGFKDLSRIGVITLIATVIAMLLASMTHHSESIVLALVFLEMFQIALIQRSRHHMRTLRCQVSS